jgi:nucleoside-triphosphatase THEP1|tara:strand:- start:135 stop:404 length:270 start_codon:yes stop_codon:yes gene_type:complete
MFWKKDNTDKLKIEELERKVNALDRSIVSILGSMEILSNRLDKHVEFISSISKTNNLLLKIVDYQNSPSGKNNDDLKFLGFVYDEDEER